MASVFVHINNPELAGVVEHAFSASTWEQRQVEREFCEFKSILREF